MIRSIHIDFPDNFELNDDEIKIILAVKLYELGKITLGQGAKMVNQSVQEFSQILGKYNVSIFNYPPTDLSRDVKNA